MTTPLAPELDINELRLTARDRRRLLDDVAADALTAAADEIEHLRAQLRADIATKPRIIDTAAELDALPVSSVLRSLGPYGGSWQVTDEEDFKRYSSEVDNSYSTGSIFLDQCGPFELLWNPPTP